ncbi:MAG: hypothetical protein H0T89_23350 [Deltaproteobacteria bacterium]|nr:hypothetical protein [Deltaproteobacteria bacterium]MDQ3298729.1 hypothetical protein [Myxococcota bacterium]
MTTTTQTASTHLTSITTRQRGSRVRDGVFAILVTLVAVVSVASVATAANAANTTTQLAAR